MKLSLRKSERTWGIRTLVAATVMGALSLSGFATAIDDAETELNYQLTQLGKDNLVGASEYVKFKDLAKAIKGAILTGSAGGPYASGTATPNLDAEAVIALVQVAVDVSKGGNDDPEAAATYLKEVFGADAKLPKESEAYPGGALTSGSAVKAAINAALQGADSMDEANWALAAKNAAKGKKFAVAMAEEFFGTSYFGGTSADDIQEAAVRLMKADKGFNADTLITMLTLSGTGIQQDIRLGAFAGDKGKVEYLVAAAIKAGSDADDAYTDAETVITSAKIKRDRVEAAKFAAELVLAQGTSAASGTAVQYALTTGTAGDLGGYTTYGPGSKNESWRLTKQIVGAATIANPDHANRIIAMMLQTGEYTQSGKQKNWAAKRGHHAIEFTLKYAGLADRLNNTSTPVGTGGSEAAAAIVQQALLAVQTPNSLLSTKDMQKAIKKLVGTAVKVVFKKVDMDPGIKKANYDAGVVAGAAVGGVVAVTGTATSDAVAKPADKGLTAAGYDQAALFAVVNAALKTVKKNKTLVQAVAEATAQAVGYITGFYGSNAAAATDLKEGLLDAALAAKIVDVATATTLELTGWINAAFDAGAAGTASIGAYGTRDPISGNLYETYWSGFATKAPVNVPITDISGL